MINFSVLIMLETLTHTTPNPAGLWQKGAIVDLSSTVQCLIFSTNTRHGHVHVRDAPFTFEQLDSELARNHFNDSGAFLAKGAYVFLIDDLSVDDAMCLADSRCVTMTWTEFKAAVKKRVTNGTSLGDLLTDEDI